MRLAPLALTCSALAVASFVTLPALAQAPQPGGWAEIDPEPEEPPPPPVAPPPPRRRAPVILPQDAPPPPPAIIPAPPGQPLPPNVQAGPGGVTVHETAQGPVDVHATTPDGTVHAYGCARVDVDPQARSRPMPPNAPPCPVTPYYYPYPVYAVPLVPYYPARYFVRPKPRYAPDPGRSAVIALSAVAFGVGTLGSGMAYAEAVSTSHCGGIHGCNDSVGARAALYSMGAFMSVPASIPRFAMGDTGIGLLFTGIRAGSFALGVAPNWGHDNWAAPVTFAFAVPIALSIVDLATTPHREQMQPKRAHAAAKPGVRLEGLAPTVALDKRGNAVPSLGALGRF